MGRQERQALLRLAARSIRRGLEEGRPEPVAGPLPPALAARRAAFVSLHRAGGELRGCIGSLLATRALAAEVSHQAFAAAFQDPRFLPVEAWELAGLHLEISVLSPPEPVAAADEEALLGLLRPGEDGLILEEPASGRRATFLPLVWRSLPEPAAFLAALKQKAGLPAHRPVPGLRFWRYRAEAFAAEASVARLLEEAADGRPDGSPGEGMEDEGRGPAAQA
ncbi:MAG: AmmeMemoRadiSam system protein A [Gammaproteobacteria bacterium]|nr:MAG: AmmeMemoRadiSam system protein A [Gammaproteobacteria bacterium]